MRLRIKVKTAVWLHGLAFLFCEEDSTKHGLGLRCHTELSVGSASPVSLENGAGFGPAFGPGTAEELRQVSGTKGKDLC